MITEAASLLKLDIFEAKTLGLSLTITLQILTASGSLTRGGPPPG